MIKKIILCFLIGVLFLNLTFSTAQGFRNDIDQQAMTNLRDHTSKLKSWSCTGISQEVFSKTHKDKIIEIISNDFKKKKIPFKYEPKMNRWGDEYKHAFIYASKLNDYIFGEMDIINSSETEIPYPDKKTVLSMLVNGNAISFRNGISSTISGEKTSKLITETTSQQYNNFTAIGFNVGRYRTEDMISKFGFKYINRKTLPFFGEVLVFSGIEPITHSQGTFYLAPAFDYMTIHTEFVSSKPANKSISNVTKASKVNGFWLPEKMETNLFSSSTGSNNLDTTRTYQIHHYSVNNVSDDMLSIHEEPGDHKQIGITGAMYEIGKNGEMIYLDASGKNNAKFMWPGWLYMASVTSLIVLTVGAYVNWKRKQWPKSA